MDQNNPASTPLYVDTAVHGYLAESAKWAKFLAILGFIMCGFIVLMAFFIGTVMKLMNPMSGIDDLTGSGLPITGLAGGTFLTVLYLILAAVYFIPCLFLYRFADRTQRALLGQDQMLFSSGVHQLKAWFKFMGILAIIGLCFYFIAILGAIFFATTFSSM